MGGVGQMKKSTNSQIRLGVFLTLGIALFVVGIYLIGERQQLFRSTFKLVGIFSDVGGLQAGNNVRLSGVNIGTIDNISIVSDSLVQVEMIIDEEVRRFVKQDAIASIGAEGLMGNKVVVIEPGTGQERAIADNSKIMTASPWSWRTS